MFGVAFPKACLIAFAANIAALSEGTAFFEERLHSFPTAFYAGAVFLALNGCYKRKSARTWKDPSALSAIGFEHGTKGLLP